MTLHPKVAEVTERVIERSRDGRARYLDLIERQKDEGTRRSVLSCGNLAHAFAASGEDKSTIRRRAPPIWLSSPPIMTCCPPMRPIIAIPS